MAKKKAKTPTPPRTAQGPKKRGGPPSGRVTPGTKWLPIVLAVLGAGVLAAVAVALTSGGGGGSSDSVRSAMEAAGCTYEEAEPTAPKDKVNFHADVPSLDTKIDWSTDPPSAGSHYGLWAIWNFYREPVNPRLVAHNLEHGAVAIWWGPKVPAETVDRLEAFYREKPEAMIGTPYAMLGDKIALTSWTGDPARYYKNGHYGTGHIAVCSDFDEGAFRTFRDAYRGEGPEGVPISASQPGSGPG
jgi:hypothetical protein